jgi:hypothetical protein
MGYVSANEIQVLVFDELCNNKLVGTRHSLVLGDQRARYTWDSTYCPEGYQALGNALFVKILTPPSIQPERMGSVLHVSEEGVTRWIYEPEKGECVFIKDHGELSRPCT